MGAGREEDTDVLHKAVLPNNTPVFLLLRTCFEVGEESKKRPGGFYFNPF